MSRKYPENFFLMAAFLEKRNHTMLYLYPDKHTYALDLDVLVQRANRGELFLLMEDSLAARGFGSKFVDGLEPTSLMGANTMLACMVMMSDVSHATLGDMVSGQAFPLYAMLVFMLKTHPDAKFERANDVANELKKMHVPDLHSLYEIVKAISDALLGGVPKSIKLEDIRQFVADTIRERTGVPTKKHMAYYQFIRREKIMADKINAVRLAHPDRDVHVVVGACHVSGGDSEALLDSLAVNLPAYQELHALIEEYYPKQRLVDLIGEHSLR
jgi:hypothetical protein